jgi:hypothetical protein
MKFLLLVTWFMHDQPPSNYQVTFSSSEACETARLQVIKEAERVRQDIVRAAPDRELGRTLSALHGPTVSAVCVTQ